MDRTQLFDSLSNLPTAAFERLLVAVNMPRMNRAGASAKIGDQVSALLEWADSNIGPGVEAIARYLAELNHFEFDAYLRSLVATYEKWWEHYTLTDAIGKVELPEKPSAFDFGLMVQTVTKERESTDPENTPLQQDKEKTERLPVLEGIRKYADDHVLLVGRPGSGKSTALIRLLLEEAAHSSRSAERYTPSPSPKLGRGEQERIPVLVELRYWESSIEGLIQGFLQRHNLALDDTTLSTLLSEGQFLLLVDGLNELPSEEARTQLSAFRRNHPKLPMIFTTRDLGLGGDLGIEKKLEMQPLTEAQMKAFIRAYVPDQAEAMLRQLSDRLRKFGQTPLLLWMLCQLFQQTTKIPENLGMVFRLFTQQYEGELKSDGVIESDRGWWNPVLRQLAWVMMQGKTPTDFRVAIPQAEAVGAIAEFLKEKVPYAEDFARKCLRDLQKYHLIQADASSQELEFRHQLIQEYYAAEYLWERLPDLLKDEDKFKRDYLNLVKWTEAIALMLALVEDEVQALRVVKLAIDVDWALVARLTRSLESDIQDCVVKFIDNSNLPKRFKIKLLGLTHNSNTIPILISHLGNSSLDIRETATQALGEIGCKKSVSALEKLISDENHIFVITNVITALEGIGTDAAITSLHKALALENSSIRYHVAKALANLQDKTGFEFLLNNLEDSDLTVRRRAAELLGGMGNVQAIPRLTQSLSDPNPDVSWEAAFALGRLGNEAATPVLIDAKNPHSVCKILGEIRSEKTVGALFQILEKEDPFSFNEAAHALARLHDRKVIPFLIKALKSADIHLLLGISEIFGEFHGDNKWGAEKDLISIFRNKNFCVLSRSEAAKSLGKIGCKSEEFIALLLRLSKYEDKLIRETSIEILGDIGCDDCIDVLYEALKDKDWSVRFKAMSGLSKAGIFNPETLASLIQYLENYEYYEEHDIWHHNDELSWMAAEALENLGGSILPSLKKSFFSHHSENTPHFNALMYAVEKVQDRCKYYSHELFYSLIPQGKTISLYFSYAPADEALQIQLTNHLALLERQGVITSWSSHQILPGEDRTQNIHHQLNTADIILLLISPDAIANDTCYHIEFQRAIERQQSGEARVIPILLRPVDWQGAPFSQLDVLPKNHQPVTTWPNQDEAFREIAEGIRTVAMELRKDKGNDQNSPS